MPVLRLTPRCTSLRRKLKSPRVRRLGQLPTTARPRAVSSFRESQRVIIDVFNDTKVPELVHWHGLFVPSEVDGSSEEGTPLIPPKSAQRYSFIARPAGTRWYHTHVPAGLNLSRGTYTGQFGMMYVVVVPGRKTVEVELLADNPGATLFHCHNQLHMDFGFMTLFHYA